MCHCGIDFMWVYWAGIRQWLFDWQTLITGFMALGAAFAALQPVRKQLALMRAQNNVMVRDTIGHMITQIDVHCERMNEITGKPITGVHTGLYHYEQYGDRGFEHWAAETSSEVTTMHHKLKDLFITAHDVAAVEQEKNRLLGAVSNLSSCFQDIVAPILATVFPPDDPITEEKMKALDMRAVEARKELDVRASHASMVIRQLREAYASHRATLVHQLRVIDDGLLKDLAR